MCSARRALGEDEPDEVGSRFDGSVDVVLVRHPAHLDQRSREQLGELRAGIACAHQRRTDEDRVATNHRRTVHLATRLEVPYGFPCRAIDAMQTLVPTADDHPVLRRQADSRDSRFGWVPAK